MRAFLTPLLAALLLGWTLPVAAVDLGGGVGNVTPFITSVTVGASFDPTAGTTTSIPVSTVITDPNGCNDLTTGSAAVTAAIYTSADVLQVAATALSFSSCNIGIQATFAGNVPMPFHAAAGTYKVRVSATDQAAANVLDSLATAPTFAYTSLVAMTSDASFSFGSTLSPGAASTAGVGVAVTNAGNAQIDTQVSGTALTLASPSASIAVGNVKYSLNSDMTSSTALTGSAASISAFNLAAGAASSRTLYLQLTVPDAASQYVPAGTYAGTLTITAVAG